MSNTVISGKSMCKVPMLDEARGLKRNNGEFQGRALSEILAAHLPKACVGVCALAKACTDYSRLFEALVFLVPPEGKDQRLVKVFSDTKNYPGDTAAVRWATNNAKDITEDAIQHELDVRGNVSHALVQAAFVVQAIQIIAAEMEEAELDEAKSTSPRWRSRNNKRGPSVEAPVATPVDTK